jgi:NDP-4-keto-2,6-dideoxyhexose 3-C-methyltransferase
MRTITTCRSCWSDDLEEILDLGEQYVSDFREDKSKPNKYPVTAVICKDCLLVQLRHTTPSQEMYHENYGFKSGISNSIKDDLKDIVSTALEYADHCNNWLDIASNDGTLLSYVPNVIHRTGVDPITKYCEEAEQHADIILNEFFSADEFDPEQTFDVITAISCFYDMDKPNDFVGDVARVLADDGIWVIQQNYLLTTMELGAVDNFCHEHLEYYTLASLEPLLERHGLEVIDLSTSTVNGGSLRTIVAKKGVYNVSDNVEYQRKIERTYGLLEINTYKQFARKAMVNLAQLRELIDKLKAEGNEIAILAASTRGATIWQSAGIGKKQIAYAVERNPEKVGKYFSAVGIPIISEAKFRENKPAYAIVGPWFFAPEVIDREQEYIRSGGHLIIPLPEIQIV